MSDTNEILHIGIDLSDSYAMVSFYQQGMTDAKTVSTTSGAEHYAIPAALLKTIRGKYFYGEEALKRKDHTGAVFYDNLMAEALKERQKSGGSKETGTHSSFSALSIFFKRLLKFRREYQDSDEEPYALAVTVPVLSKEHVLLLHDLIRDLDHAPENLRLSDHRESFADYMMHQERTLTLHESALFECFGNEVIFYQLGFGRQENKRLVYVTEDSFTIPEETAADPDLKDRYFADVIHASLGKRLLSAVYLIGKGFDDCRMTETIRAIGPTRRIFAGKNLYTKGACFGLLPEEKRYIYHGEYKVHYDVTIPLIVRGKEQDIRLLYANSNWFDNYYSGRILYNDSDTISFYRSTGAENDVKKELLAKIRIEDLPRAQERSVRLFLEVTCEDAKTMYVRLADDGFGELFESTKKRWEYRVALPEV